MIDLKVVYKWGAGIVVALLLYWHLSSDATAKGARDAKLALTEARLDSARDAYNIIEKMLTARVKADSVDSLAHLKAQAQTDAKVNASNAALTKYRTAHDSADAVLRDSLATAAELRSTLAAILARQDSLNGAFAKERAGWEAERLTATAYLAAKDSLLTTRTQQVASLTAQASALTQEVALLKKDRPSILSRCGVTAGYGLIVSSGKGYAGLGALAGCKVFP